MPESGDQGLMFQWQGKEGHKGKSIFAKFELFNRTHCFFPGPFTNSAGFFTTDTQWVPVFMFIHFNTE